jgi:excisionase family DNA binding protein
MNFLSIDEACNVLHFKKSYLYRLVHEHAIPYYKPRNGRVLFDEAELEDFIRKGRVATVEELSDKAVAILNSRRK